MSISKNEISKELLVKAMQCKTVEELMELAKSTGFNLTKEEAEAYFAKLGDIELDKDVLQHVAGGSCYTKCIMVVR